MAAEYPSDEWQQAYMDKIITDVVRWKNAYYNKDGGSTDDATYDLWWANLMHMERKYPHLIRSNSPTQSVGSPLA